MSWEGLQPPYTTIVADPPWPQLGAGPLRGAPGFGDARGQSRVMPYSTMTIDLIDALPVKDLSADVAHLYLWTTNGFLNNAFHTMHAWGFGYSTTLVWAKNPMGGGLGGRAFGISTEFVLFGWRGRAEAKRRIPTTWFNWKRPYNTSGKPQHSAKPVAFFDMVEEISEGPYLELFARQNRLGWDSWGWGFEAASHPGRVSKCT